MTNLSTIFIHIRNREVAFQELKGPRGRVDDSRVSPSPLNANSRYGRQPKCRVGMVVPGVLQSAFNYPTYTYSHPFPSFLCRVHGPRAPDIRIPHNSQDSLIYLRSTYAFFTNDIRKRIYTLKQPSS